MDVIISLELQLIFMLFKISMPGRDRMDLQLPMQSVPITT